MHRLSIFLLLVPVLMLAGCDGAVTTGPSGQPPVTQEPESPPANIEVLIFTAKWCPACQRDKPQVEEMRRRGVKVTEIDADEHPELVRQYGITQLPTYIVLEDGVEVKRAGDISLIISIVSVILKIVIPLIIPLLFG